MKVLPYGPRAVLVEVDDPHAVPAVRTAALSQPGVVEAVAGAVTVLVRFAGDVPRGFDLAAGVAVAPTAARRTVELPTVYDGPDLGNVAAASGLPIAEVVRVHSAAEYTVRFCGFSPGFAYLDGLDPRLQLPRRPEPRTSVPAGSVAVAGEFTGVYPRSSPGGWRLLGRTAEWLWDPAADPPARLTPGTRVRFVPA